MSGSLDVLAPKCKTIYLSRNFTSDQKISCSDQTSPMTKRSPVTSPVTTLHRWPKDHQKLHQWPNFTGDQTSPVIKLHRWPKITDELHRWPNFTGDQSTPVIKLHWFPKLHWWQIIHRWRSLTPQHGTGILHSLTIAESLALPGNKYYFDQGRPEALPNFCPWTLKLSPNMEETLGAEEVQETGTPPRGISSSDQIGHRSHGGTGLLSAAAFSAALMLRTAVITEVAEGARDGATRWSCRPPT